MVTDVPWSKLGFMPWFNDRPVDVLLGDGHQFHQSIHFGMECLTIKPSHLGVYGCIRYIWFNLRGTKPCSLLIETERISGFSRLIIFSEFSMNSKTIFSSNSPSTWINYSDRRDITGMMLGLGESPNGPTFSAWWINMNSWSYFHENISIYVYMYAI